MNNVFHKEFLLTHLVLGTSLFLHAFILKHGRIQVTEQEILGQCSQVASSCFPSK